MKLATLIVVALVGLISLGQAADSTKPPDISELRAKAEKGDPAAQFYLGGCYFYGTGVAEDPAEAAIWFRRAADFYRTAADQGDASAQPWLAVMYANGWGVAKDPTETPLLNFTSVKAISTQRTSA